MFFVPLEIKDVACSLKGLTPVKRAAEIAEMTKVLKLWFSDIEKNRDFLEGFVIMTNWVAGKEVIPYEHFVAILCLDDKKEAKIQAMLLILKGVNCE